MATRSFKTSLLLASQFHQSDSLVRIDKTSCGPYLEMISRPDKSGARDELFWISTFGKNAIQSLISGRALLSQNSLEEGEKQRFQAPLEVLFGEHVIRYE